MPLRNFSRLALVFVVLFAVLVLGNLFPLQLLNPTWQSRVAAALVNGATLPLTALALLQLARLLDPDDPQISKRQQRFAQLAIAAALGYLLLGPLMISASLRLQSSGSSEQLSRLARAERQVASLRQALSQASSNADLNARFQVLKGPSISPADLALPFPVLKAQASQALDQAQAQIQLKRNALPASDPLRLLPELLRSVVSCLALACGFAFFAQWRDDQLSLFDAQQARLSRLAQRFSPRRRQGDRALLQEEYLRQLRGDDHQEPG